MDVSSAHFVIWTFISGIVRIARVKSFKVAISAPVIPISTGLFTLSDFSDHQTGIAVKIHVSHGDSPSGDMGACFMLNDWKANNYDLMKLMD